MKPILKNNQISIQTRRALECYCEPNVIYECKDWTISEQIQKQLEIPLENAIYLMDFKEIKRNSDAT